MTIIAITDVEDLRLAPYRDLQHQSALGEESLNHFVVEGRFCVEVLARTSANGQVKTASVLVQQGREKEISAWFPESIPVFSLAKSKIRQLVGFDFHRGVLACGVVPEPKSINDLAFIHGAIPLAVAACGISDRDNLGNIIRTASAMGISRLITDRCTVSPFSRRVVRVSMGNVFSLSHYQIEDPATELGAWIAKTGGRVIATTLSDQALPLDQFHVDDRPMILVLGSESSGLDREIEEIATDQVTIEMKMATDSLNVSVAAAIFMYELERLWRKS